MRFKTFLDEARKNPEQNPKISAYEYLKQYKDNPDVYISFTDVEKIGVNPEPSHYSPVGIYCYPLQTIWEQYNIDTVQSLTILPYAATRPFIWVMEKNNSGKFIDNVAQDYTKEMLIADIETLKYIWEKRNNDNLIFDIDKIVLGLRHLKKFEFEILFRLTERMSDKLTSHRVGRLAIWNSILRECGYSGFADKDGQGLIHYAEPTQAIFLTKTAFKVLDKVPNKDFNNNVISKITDIIKLESSKNKSTLNNIHYIILKFGLGQLSNVSDVGKLNPVPSIYTNSSSSDWRAFLYHVVEYAYDQGKPLGGFVGWFEENKEFKKYMSIELFNDNLSYLKEIIENI